VADTVRPSSRDAISALKREGIAALVMLTGDNEMTARKVAEAVGVTAVRANCLPEDKVTAVAQLRHQYEHVAMVGDGINDAPALATASVGIAVGQTAQVMETADVTLMSGDLTKLPLALRLSRAAMRTIQANVAVSIGIKLAFLVLVLLGWGSLWLAVLADVGTSLLVTLNGMRLLKRPKMA
jgi:Cd2+/Zn2+-exporting ATPase